jgi:hypothetical protein
MKIEKAIEILSDPDPDIDGIMNDDYEDAIRLGIEALRRVKDGRRKAYDYFGHLLLGETDD